ncbi:hypothetical protein DENIT_30044 [Pseudomonas veronii]|nr:hypothetical protein DENIT_30044 [Pseudomonas veronii]
MRNWWVAMAKGSLASGMVASVGWGGDARPRFKISTPAPWKIIELNQQRQAEVSSVAMGAVPRGSKAHLLIKIRGHWEQPQILVRLT